MPARRFLYLHGFASGPKSSKAQYFRQQFASLGIPLEILQLDQGDFEHLTISGQLQLVEETARGQPSVLIGSSLGGYLAALYAARHAEVERVVLLAPAFRFPSYWPASLGAAKLDDWQSTGKLSVFHYAANAERSLGYEFYQDGIQYEPEPDVGQPALILHGTQDQVVPAEFSVAYAEHRPNVELHLLDSGHELSDVFDDLWRLSAAFLGLFTSLRT